MFIRKVIKKIGIPIWPRNEKSIKHYFSFFFGSREGKIFRYSDKGGEAMGVRLFHPKLESKNNDHHVSFEIMADKLRISLLYCFFFVSFALPSSLSFSSMKTVLIIYHSFIFLYPTTSTKNTFEHTRANLVRNQNRFVKIVLTQTKKQTNK